MLGQCRCLQHALILHCHSLFLCLFLCPLSVWLYKCPVRVRYSNSTRLSRTPRCPTVLRVPPGNPPQIISILKHLVVNIPWSCPRDDIHNVMEFFVTTLDSVEVLVVARTLVSNALGARVSAIALSTPQRQRVMTQREQKLSDFCSVTDLYSVPLTFYTSVWSDVTRFPAPL